MFRFHASAHAFAHSNEHVEFCTYNSTPLVRGARWLGNFVTCLFRAYIFEIQLNTMTISLASSV